MGASRVRMARSTRDCDITYVTSECLLKLELEGR